MDVTDIKGFVDGYSSFTAIDFIPGKLKAHFDLILLRQYHGFLLRWATATIRILSPLVW